MALYCQWMLQIATELAKHDPAYADMALKFLTHFEWISIAMNPPEADTALWDEQDVVVAPRSPSSRSSPCGTDLPRGIARRRPRNG